MKKIIIMGSLLAVFLLLMIPNVGAIEYGQIINKRESAIQNKIENMKEKILINNKNSEPFLFDITSDDIVSYIIAIILTYAWFTPTLIQLFFTSTIGKILWTFITSFLPIMLISNLDLPMGEFDPEDFDIAIETCVTFFILFVTYTIFSQQPEVVSLVNANLGLALRFFYYLWSGMYVVDAFGSIIILILLLLGIDLSDLIPFPLFNKENRIKNKIGNILTT